MIVMLFEYWLNPKTLDEYQQLASHMRQLVTTIDGFASVERFRSESDPDKVLTLAFFEDEAAVSAWRNLPAHRAAQAAGRQGLFLDYRLRMAEVQRDYSLHDREQVPDDSKVFDNQKETK